MTIRICQSCYRKPFPLSCYSSSPLPTASPLLHTTLRSRFQILQTQNQIRTSIISRAKRKGKTLSGDPVSSKLKLRSNDSKDQGTLRSQNQVQNGTERVSNVINEKSRNELSGIENLRWRNLLPKKVGAADPLKSLAPNLPPESIPKFENSRLLKVAVLGAANAGKSSLVNSLVGEKVSIVSSKAQTTRERISGVLTDLAKQRTSSSDHSVEEKKDQNNYQIVFYDTPGIVTMENRLKVQREVLTSSWQALNSADYLLILLDTPKLLSKSNTPVEEYMFSRLAKFADQMKVPAMLIFNKVDEIFNQCKHSSKAEFNRSSEILSLIQSGMAGYGDSKIHVRSRNMLENFGIRYQGGKRESNDGESVGLKELAEGLVETYTQKYGSVEKVVFCSAKEGWGVDVVKDHLYRHTYPSPFLYPPAQRHDIPELALVEQYIREAIFEKLWGYIPYSIKQENVGWIEQKQDGAVKDQAEEQRESTGLAERGVADRKSKVKIVQNLYVSKPSLEKIVVGKGGAVIKEVTQHAKKELERVLQREVELWLDVKVRK
ncbi:P-loop containing nucleoside triphosphate hydrolase protein [Paraphysoderma sedebokerense]|nr:P-loop containing nucleoside triphosphate hydrolase protein [Paraphysoderma sedebokerense]